jgi:hypothetical protein
MSKNDGLKVSNGLARQLTFAYHMSDREEEHFSRLIHLDSSPSVLQQDWQYMFMARGYGPRFHDRSSTRIRPNPFQVGHSEPHTLAALQLLIEIRSSDYGILEGCTASRDVRQSPFPRTKFFQRRFLTLRM